MDNLQGRKYLTVLEFSLLAFGIAYLAGLLGALTGLGGGIILTPVFVLLFHIDIHYAMGASLISVIATSSGAAIAFLKEGYTNLRIGMFLEIGAVIGAVGGALLINHLSVSIIAIIFGCVLLFSAYFAALRQESHAISPLSHLWAEKLNLTSHYPTLQGPKSYSVQRVPQALSIMTLAGALSSLLGIGSGALKVLAMDQVMGLPYKVSTATSNFIIGITAAVSAGFYFSQGYIDPVLTAPVMLGVLFGAVSGTQILRLLPTTLLRFIFSLLVVFVAIEMIYKGITGGL